MVSVTNKQVTSRTAKAGARIVLNRLAFDLIERGQQEVAGSAGRTNPKGNVLTVAQLAGIMGAKHTALLIPLCHPLALTHVDVQLIPEPHSCAINILATAECSGKTGVEMEALVAANVAALTVWDMCKAVAGKEMVISDIKVLAKSGGKSGDWVRSE